MAKQGLHNDLVAQEADRLEAAMVAAGLDPDSTLSWPIWDVFTHRGLRAAEGQLMRQLMQQQTTRRAAELDARLTAVERHYAAAGQAPAQPTALATIEQRAAQLASARKITHEQAYAQVLAADPELYDRYTVEQAAGVYASEPAPPPALAMGPVESEIDQRAARLASERRITREQAYVQIFAERPELYDAYVKEVV